MLNFPKNKQTERLTMPLLELSLDLFTGLGVPTLSKTQKLKTAL